MMIFGEVGAGGLDGVVVVGAMAGSHMGQGSWGQECQMAGEGGDGGGRRVRWQLLGVVGQKGGGTGGLDGREVGQEEDSRGADGTGAVGQGGPDDRQEGDGRVHEGQMAVAGVVGVAWGRSFKMVGSQGPDQGVRGS